MRTPADAAKLRALMERLGRESQGRGVVYIVGGGSALLYGWRPTTVDIDLKLDPEPPGVFAALNRLKNELQINIELAAPDQFIPTPPGWRDRSVFIARHGQIDFYHYDFYSQALAKIERGHGRDLADVEAMAKAGLIEANELSTMFAQIAPQLERYPGIHAPAFREKVEAMVNHLLDPKVLAR